MEGTIEFWMLKRRFRKWKFISKDPTQLTKKEKKLLKKVGVK